ncbi:MAG: cupin domain-containing protein [Candidatus Kapaibacterium sp.]|jgi:predicted cupin superfamily sugar epimerase
MMNIIEHLQLLPHPEGGFYREYYRGDLNVSTPQGDRSTATAIYFYLPPHSRSHFHRLRNDELWFWQHGGTATAYLLHNDGTLDTHQVASPASAHRGFILFPRDTWFAAETQSEGVLVSCVVAPGFSFADFELAGRTELLEAYPAHAEVIARCTREESL